MPQRRVIAVINQKGGSGKTTTTVNLGACLAMLGKVVLLIDLDPQANTTIHLGLKPHDIKYSLYEVMMEEKPLRSVIRPTEVENLFIAPANINLSGAEIELSGVVGREMVLKDAVERMQNSQDYALHFDYILIDCPPSLGLLTVNALTVAREIIIPVQTEFFALEGMGKLFQTVDIVRKRLNRDLTITGIVPTMFDVRTNLSREVMDRIKSYFGDKVYGSFIRKNVRLAEATSHGKPIVLYDPRSTGAEDYIALAKEVESGE
ncbi:MAG: AAA family ATPase [Candidatus Methanosuratincola sp.]|jgi:chromosome partitioning protein